MELERQYLAALDLTHQMLDAANAQDWDTLSGLERQRAAVFADTPPISKDLPLRDPALATRIARLIGEMEAESASIVEQVQGWQEGARILLRLDKPAPA